MEESHQAKQWQLTNGGGYIIIVNLSVCLDGIIQVLDHKDIDEVCYDISRNSNPPSPHKSLEIPVIFNLHIVIEFSNLVDINL